MMKTIADLTDNEKASILARTNEASIKDVAEEFDISPETVTDLIYAPKKDMDISEQPTIKPLKKLGDLTDEDRLAIIRMSDEIGIPQTAQNFNTSIRNVSYCRFEYARKKGITVKNLTNRNNRNNRNKKNSAPVIETAIKTVADVAEAAETITDNQTTVDEQSIETNENAVHNTTFDTKYVNEKREKREKREKHEKHENLEEHEGAENLASLKNITTNASTVTAATAATFAFDDEKTALIIENALLKEKLSVMTMQIEKLKRTMKELII